MKWAASKNVELLEGLVLNLSDAINMFLNDNNYFWYKIKAFNIMSLLVFYYIASYIMYKKLS